MKSDITQNISEIQRRIATACQAHNRRVEDITLVAVTKTFPVSAIEAAIAVGIDNIGESKVQEAEKKFNELAAGKVRRHMIGHLQSNKAKKAVQLFDVIQSVDSLKLAQEISRHATATNKTIECLIEVNTSGEIQKHGVAPEAALELVSQVTPLPNIMLTGLMTIGPLTEDETAIRKSFQLCRDLFVQAKKTTGNKFSILSMGMSGDFELAIAEGSTLVRVGSAIFGSRPRQNEDSSDPE